MSVNSLSLLQKSKMSISVYLNSIFSTMICRSTTFKSTEIAIKFTTFYRLSKIYRKVSKNLTLIAQFASRWVSPLFDSFFIYWVTSSPLNSFTSQIRWESKWSEQSPLWKLEIYFCRRENIAFEYEWWWWWDGTQLNCDWLSVERFNYLLVSGFWIVYLIIQCKFASNPFRFILNEGK